MASPRRAFVLLVIAFSLASVYAARAQPAGEIVVASDVQMLSLGDVSGWGRATWTLTGDQAAALRSKVLMMYDEGMSIPPGFAFALQTTGATVASVGNGVLESAEAAEYLANLERQLEGVLRSFSGTDFRFLRITRADRVESDLPPERSTSGLVGTTAGTVENLEIRFIFNANTRSPERTFLQADLALANALHEVFAFDASEDLGAAGCPPMCYPFPAIDGWRVVASPPSPPWAPGSFLWHGNAGATPWNSTGAYEPDASNVTWYAPVGTTEGPIDLRFASSANFTFEHTGRAASGDVLAVQISEDQATWTNLRAVGDTDDAVDGYDLSILATATYDLNPWLGRSVYLRLNFTANGDATTSGPGYYVRNLRIQAPSLASGTVDFRHVDYEVGFLSFSHFDAPYVKPHLIRTPVGEVLFYSAVYNASAPPEDRTRFATFDFVENPQVLFVLLLVSAWLMRLFQDRSFESYRMKHSASIRAAATKVKWLHWIRLLLVILLVLLYFFPTALIGAGLVVGGLAFWVLSLGFLFGLTGFSMFWYRRLGALIPPEPSPAPGEVFAADLPPPPPPAPEDLPPRLICAHCDADIERLEDAHRCECGHIYYKAHAVELGMCANCGRPLDVELPPEEKMMSVRCPACGEVQVVPEAANLRFETCDHCKQVLQDVPRGYNYLVIAEEPHLAYAWFNNVVRRGAAGLCISTTFPEKLRRQYGLPEVELYWVSDTSPGPKTLDPRRLDFEIMRALSNFVKNRHGGALVLDGIEYLVVENTFDRVLKFIKKVNDLASVHDCTMFVPITPTGLGPEEATLLRKEFDRVEVIPSGGD